MKINEGFLESPRHEPFWVSDMEIKRGLPFPCKILARERYSCYSIAISTDDHPLLWIWYWVAIRVSKSIELLKWVWIDGGC